MSTDSDTSLSDLFVRITGEETVTETRTDGPSHGVVEEPSLDETSLADGLDEALDGSFSETDVA